MERKCRVPYRCDLPITQFNRSKKKMRQEHIRITIPQIKWYETFEHAHNFFVCHFIYTYIRILHFTTTVNTNSSVRFRLYLQFVWSNKRRMMWKMHLVPNSRCKAMHDDEFDGEKENAQDVARDNWDPRIKESLQVIICVECRDVYKRNAAYLPIYGYLMFDCFFANTLSFAPSFASFFIWYSFCLLFFA